MLSKCGGGKNFQKKERVCFICYNICGKGSSSSIAKKSAASSLAEAKGSMNTFHLNNSKLKMKAIQSSHHTSYI